MINQTSPAAISIRASRTNRSFLDSVVRFDNRSLVLYLVFGGIAAITNLSVGWLLYGVVIIPNMPYWAATALSASFGLVTNFYLNYSFNFRYRGRAAIDQFGTFCVVSGFGILLTSVFSVMAKSIMIFIDIRLDFVFSGAAVDFIAHLVAVGLVVLYSYSAHKALTFNVGLCAHLQELKSAITD